MTGLVVLTIPCQTAMLLSVTLTVKVLVAVNLTSGGEADVVPQWIIAHVRDVSTTENMVRDISILRFHYFLATKQSWNYL